MTTAKPIVFVVDDDVWLRESLETLIKDEGWQPETFASAQEFLDHPPTFSPSCLVLDICLPGLNGLELQKRVAVERTDMPIIFITGHGDIPMSVGAMKAGAVEFLTKPFNDTVLLEAIRQALERYTPSNSRSQLMQKGSNKIILDAYNANPSSMKLAIENFARTEGDNKILVLGAMAELGTESLQEHQNIVDIIGKWSWQEVMLVGGDFTKLQHPYQQYLSAADAGKDLQKQNLQNAFLLIKGSRSTGMEAVLNYL